MPERDDSNLGEVMHRTSDYTPPRSLSHYLIGRPLQTADAPHQTIGKAIGLAVFASDALSSTAYATQEILGVLAVVGTLAFGLVFPISLAIVVLLTIVTLSYEQTIHAYPGGGGSYIVARDNLGELPAQIAGAALLTDYVLTVAVSVSSGIAQVVSAYPLADRLHEREAVPDDAPHPDLTGRRHAVALPEVGDLPGVPCPLDRQGQSAERAVGRERPFPGADPVRDGRSRHGRLRRDRGG